MARDKLKISLRKNGEHSFKRGLEAYKDYEKTQEDMLLKDAIMFLHHGIELLMKEVLVHHSPYLIFEELKEIPSKQKQADNQGISVFALPHPPRTASYEVALDRVEAFIKPSELNNELVKNLKMLNRLRNQIEHHAVEVDRDEVVQILAAIHNPLLKLFEAELGTLTQLRTSKAEQIWNNIEDVVERKKLITQEIHNLLKKFNGQSVPGYLFNVEGKVFLPKFSRIVDDYIPDYGYFKVSLWAESEDFLKEEHNTQWVIEIKMSNVSSQVVYALAGLSSAMGFLTWLIVYDGISSDAIIAAKSLNIMFTEAEKLQELKKLIE